ncbi:MAG: class I SAM-dependent methyltransferase, partial [Lewinella sp.]|nr:class I SAM-dependent methyltransferase [Lewinella sp.]
MNEHAAPFWNFSPLPLSATAVTPELGGSSTSADGCAWPWLSCRQRRLLDVGCGTGELYTALAAVQRQSDYHGLDLSPEMLALSPIPAQQRSLLGLEDFAAKAAKSYTALVALGLTTYYQPEELTAFYRAVQSVLTPQGRAIISFTHARSWDFRFRQWARRWLAPLLPRQRSLGANFAVFATTPTELAKHLPPTLYLQSCYWLPAAPPFLPQLLPRWARALALGWASHWGSAWRGDFV